MTLFYCCFQSLRNQYLRITTLIILIVIRYKLNYLTMGTNPSKTQQLAAMFPQLKVMPEFTVQPSNSYELIYVSKPKTNQIFIIKESTRQPNDKNIFKSQNVIKFYDCRKIDTMFYSLYEWVPQSLERFVEANSLTVNKNFAIYVIQNLIKVYSMLWKSCDGNGLDITLDNVRVTRNSSGGVCVKVLPPYVTQCSFPQRKIAYRNRIKDLGEVVYSIFKQKQRQIGANTIGFIVNRIRGFNTITNNLSWESLQKDSEILTPEYQISPQQLNHFKYSNIQILGKENRERSVSPIANEQFKRQVAIDYPPKIVNQRPISPYSTSNVGIPRDVSPQISRVCHYNQKPAPIVYANKHRPTSPHCVAQMKLMGNENISLPNRPLGNIGSNINLHTNPHLISNINSNSNYHNGNGLIIHQNLQKNKLNTPTNTTQNLSSHLNHTDQSKCNKTESRINIQLDTSQNQSSIYGENVLVSQTNPSPMRYFPSTTSPSATPDKRHSYNLVKPQVHLQEFDGKINNLIINTTQGQMNEKYKTQEKRNQYLIRPNNRPVNLENINSGTNDNYQYKTNSNSQGNYKFQARQVRQNKSKKLNLYPLFQPSSPDLLQIRPKSGVPELNYNPKTRQDKHLSEEGPENNRNTLNFKNQSSDFSKNLIKENTNVRELLGSSIPVAIDKSSSFGLTVSEDSEAGNYDGVYEGSYHSSFSNMKHGVGKLIFPSGGSYQGNFSWNKMDGWGKLFYPSGRLAYEGYWKNNKFEGYGKLFNQCPQHTQVFDYRNFNKIQGNQEGYWKYYEGNMKNDMKQGHGIWVLENGQKYDGEFHQDMVHGAGVFYGKKQVVEGVWENNILSKINYKQ